MHHLADPLVLLALVSLGGLLLIRLGRPRTGGAVLIGSVLGLWLLAAPLVADLLLESLEVDAAPVPAGSGPVPQAIVVLGGDVRREAAEYGGDTVGDLTLERLRFGARLHRETGLPILVTGGRVAGSQVSVGRLMARSLSADFGIEAGWIEEASRNTFENATGSAAILERAGIGTVHLVTHAWHMRRALASFQVAGLVAVPAATNHTRFDRSPSPEDLVPSSHALAASAYALHEWIGYLWYRLVYW